MRELMRHERWEMKVLGHQTWGLPVRFVVKRVSDGQLQGHGRIGRWMVSCDWCLAAAKVRIGLPVLVIP